MRLSIDHIPFICNSTATLEASFRQLGFRCSHRGEYTSPEFPKVAWQTTCVFLAQGWFDLLEAIEAPDLGTPSGCLFLANNLSAVLDGMNQIRPNSQYSLERRWFDSAEMGEHFELASFREKICRLPVSVIQHQSPCSDIDRSWLQHPNTAIRLEGLFCSSSKTEKTSELNQLLDTTQAINLAPDEFEQRFGANSPNVAVQVRVENRHRLTTHLDTESIPHVQKETRVLAYPPSLDCVFEFNT